jgi:hypothetical protein
MTRILTFAMLSGLRTALPMVLVLALLMAPAASAQRVTFHVSEPEVLEQRLKEVARSNRDRKLRLAAMMEEAGCAGEALTRQAVKGSRLPNVICTLPGEGAGVIVVGAHYDKVSVGMGAVDNWSGTVLLPGLVESLLRMPRRHTFVVVGFTDEEKGLVGSRGYLTLLSDEQRAEIRAMINLDTLGLSPTKGWLSRADKHLAERLAATAAAVGLPLEWVNVDAVGSSDSESFRARGIPAITIHSLTQETLPILHSTRDTLAAVRFQDLYETYRLMAAYLAVLDAALSPQPEVAGAGVASESE